MEKNNVCETNQDILKALQQQIADLQKEIENMRPPIKETRTNFQNRYIYRCATAQAEMDYIFKDNSRFSSKRRVLNANAYYEPIRKAATICIMNYKDEAYPYGCNKLKTLRDMDDMEFQFVIECADEITRVIAAKKKEFQKAKYGDKVFA